MSIEDRYEALRKAYEPSEVGHRIRILRQVWELSQSGMGRHLNTRHNTISQFEGGLSRPAVDVEIRIKAAFGVTIDWLRFGETAGMRPELVAQLEEVALQLRKKERERDPKVPEKRPRQFARPARKSPTKK